MRTGIMQLTSTYGCIINRPHVYDGVSYNYTLLILQH